jgi:polyisoprenoid-binding protein YceI
MLKNFWMTLLLVFILIACSSQAVPQSEPTTIPATQPLQVEPVQPTLTQEIETESPTPAPTETIAAAVASDDSVIIYTIVPGESRLTYEVNEVFINQNNLLNVAIGTSDQVAGEIRVDKNEPQNSSLDVIQADISQLRSDSSRRDNAIRERFLHSLQYPMVTFLANQIDGLPASYQDGQEIPLQISGDLTIREVTQPVVFDTLVKIDGNTLTAIGTTTFLMSDFGFGPISIAGILKTEDEVKITVEIVAKS